MTTHELSATELRLWNLLREEVYAASGIVLGPRDLNLALATLMELSSASSLTAERYLHRINQVERTVDREQLIDRLTIGTTWFLREPAGLSALVNAFKSESTTGAALRLWCAGCSTGQEPYGLAMLLIEAGLSPRIIATDINQTALRTATTGCYSTREVETLPARFRQRYMVQRGAELWQVRGAVRKAVSFAMHNLAALPATPPPGGPFDAVICRNVLIYFDREMAISVVRRLPAACRPGGYILLSATERPLAWQIKDLEEADWRADAVLLRCQGGKISAPRLDPPPTKSTTPPAVIVPHVQPQQATRVHENSARVTIDAAFKALEADDHKHALTLLEDLLARDPLQATAHLLHGLVLKRAAKPRAAAAALRRARFLCPDNAWLAPYLLALLLEQIGDPADAREAYRHALTILESGGESGLPCSSLIKESLIETVAETCRTRLAALTIR